jgi:K+-sensing histidine kinase KdpD
MKKQVFLTPVASFIAATVFSVILGIIDWASGYELQFFVFYFIPVAFAAWSCGAVCSFAIAILSAIIWYVADLFSSHPYTHMSYGLWNTTIRLLSFLVVGFTISRIREMLRAQYKISEELQTALSEVKTLTGLLPICASCKKIRNDSGYWQKLEEYIEKHTTAQFTHGLCNECAAKMLAEVGIKMNLTE